MAEILVALAAVLWALLGIFSVQIHKFGFSSTEISALRWIFAAVIMFVLVLVTDRKKLKIKLKDVWMFALAGIFSYMLTSMFYFISMGLTSAAVANVLMYASPVWVLIMSRIFFNEKFNAIKLISIFGTVGGCVLVSGLMSKGSGVFNAVGIAFGVMSGVSYSAYSIIGKALLTKYSNATLTAYACIFAGIASVFTINPQSIINIISAAPKSLIYIIAMATLSTAVPYMLYTVGLSSTTASRAAVIACIEPVCSTLISVFVLKENVVLSQYVGIAVILLMILILQFSKDDGGDVLPETCRKSA